jgi:hypothetical protein
MAITTLLILAALVLSTYALIESRGRGVLTWACFCLSLALCWPLVR